MQNLLERALGKVVNEMKYGTMSEITKNMPVVYLNQFPYPKYKSEEYLTLKFFLKKLIVVKLVISLYFIKFPLKFYDFNF